MSRYSYLVTADLVRKRNNISKQLSTSTRREIFRYVDTRCSYPEYADERCSFMCAENNYRTDTPLSQKYLVPGVSNIKPSRKSRRKSSRFSRAADRERSTQLRARTATLRERISERVAPVASCPRARPLGRSFANETRKIIGSQDRPLSYQQQKPRYSSAPLPPTRKLS